MKILIDGATWTNCRGYGRFTRELVAALLARADVGTSFCMLVDPVARAAGGFPAGLEIIEVPVSKPPSEAASAEGARSLRDLFAFRKAVALAPQAPGPPFLLGQAYLQSGQMAEAKVAWLSALTLAPRDAPYRIKIAERLVLIDQFMTMQAGQQAPAPGQTGG